MSPAKNTPERWNKFWNRQVSSAEDRFDLAFEEHSIRWQRLESRVLDHFGGFDGLRVIEIGAGRGTNAALFAKRGAEVTVLDYSDVALQRSEQFFTRIGLRARTVYGNALELPEDLLGQFDVALSFGLTDQFLGRERDAINKAHFDLVRPGGMVFISVPHRNNLPYRIFKLIAEKSGRWEAREEHPYSRSEFRTICKRTGINQYEFFGESFAQSLQFLNPLKQRSFRGLLGLWPRDYSRTGCRKHRGSLLDTPLSYSLVLCGKKAA